jgi:hypothetical protein
MTTTDANATVDGEVAQWRPTIADARATVRDFFQEMLADVQGVNVTKLLPLRPEEGAWEAEAVVLLPNAAVAALGLPIQRPVLEQQIYVVRLDHRLNVLGYELKEGE